MVAEEPKPEQRSSGLSGWTDADRRTLVITVVGGLIVNIATVLVVAVAIIYARYRKLDYASFADAFGFACGSGSLLAVMAAQWFKLPREKKNRVFTKLLFSVGCGLGGLIFIESVLLILGLALQVK
jgi:hypothetical protein